MLRLLCVTAHPDDEAGGFGGMLRLYADRGVRTSVLCLTPGQAATHRGNAKTEAELVAIRRAEFQASCRLLGVSEAEVLDYPDGKLDQLDFRAVTADLTRRVRRFRPHVMTTFGTEGAITAHPDHSMAALFTTMAFHWAGRANRFPEQLENGLAPWQPQKLYYSTAGFTMPDRPPVSPAPITAVLNIGELTEIKRQGFYLHASQAPLFPFFDEAFKRGLCDEVYHLAASATPMTAKRESDLFEGVADSD